MEKWHMQLQWEGRFPVLSTSLLSFQDRILFWCLMGVGGAVISYTTFCYFNIWWSPQWQLSILNSSPANDCKDTCGNKYPVRIRRRVCVTHLHVLSFVWVFLSVLWFPLTVQTCEVGWTGNSKLPVGVYMCVRMYPVPHPVHAGVWLDRRSFTASPV